MIFDASAKPEPLIDPFGRAITYVCKFACNSDPLRGGFRVQS